MKRKRTDVVRAPDGVYVDGNKLTEMTRIDLERMRIADVKPRGDYHKVTILHRCTQWKTALKCLANDASLKIALVSFIETFDMHFALDEALLDALYEISPADETRNLAHTVARHVITFDLVCYLGEMYRRFFIWCGVLGGAPIAYIHMHDVSRFVTEEPTTVYTLDHVLRAARKENRVFTQFDTNWRRSDLATAVAHCLKESVHTALMREMRVKIDHIPKAAAAPVVLTAIEIIKRFRDGYIPHVPRIDTAAVYFDHLKKTTTAVSDTSATYSNFRWAWSQPTATESDSIVLESPIAAAADESRLFMAIKEQFFHATLVNAKRSIVISPTAISAETTAQTELKNNVLQDYFSALSDRYPHQLYADIVRTTRLADDVTQTRIATATLGGAGSIQQTPGVVSAPNILGTADILEGYEDHARRRILGDMRTMLEDYKYAAKAYDDLKTFIDAYSDRNTTKLNAIYARMCDADRELTRELLKSSIGMAEPDRPEIHRVDHSSKLLAMYNATISVGDIEDLCYVNNLMWKTRLSGIPLYSRRKNTIQYNNHNEEHTSASTIVSHFCAAVNYEMVLIKRPVEPRNTTTVNDLFIIDKVVDKTPAIRALMAKTLALKPTEVSLLPNIDMLNFLTRQQQTADASPIKKSLRTTTLTGLSNIIA